MDVENSSKLILIIMSSPILLPLILLLSSSVNVCNARQLGLCRKGFCKYEEKAMVETAINIPEKQTKSSPGEIRMQQARSLRGEVTIDRGACIEKQTDFAVNEIVGGTTSDAVSATANTIRSLYTVSSEIAQEKAEEHEPVEFHLDYLEPQVYPPTHN